MSKETFIDGNKTLIDTNYYLYLLQTENNWKKLKKLLEDLIKESGLEGIIQASIFNHVLEKMQEMEIGNNG